MHIRDKNPFLLVYTCNIPDRREIPWWVETHQAGLRADEDAVGRLALLQVGEGDGRDATPDCGLAYLE